MIPNQQPGLPTVLNKEQADIQGKAQAFLMSGDQIGFIGRLASEAPTEIAPVVNAARRMAKEAQAAQQPQTESITTAGMREVEQAKRGLAAAYELSQSQQQRDPRQTAIAGLPMQKQMFAGKRAGGIVAFAGPEGSYVNPISNQEKLRLLEKRIAESKTPNFADLMERRTLTSIIGRNKVGEDYQDLLKLAADPRTKGAMETYEAQKEKPEDPKNRFEEILQSISNFGGVKSFSDFSESEIAKEIMGKDLRKTDQLEGMTKEELEADMKRSGVEEREEAEMRYKENIAQEQLNEKAKQTIVPETATDAAIEKARVDTKPMSVKDAFAQAEKLLKPVNISQNGAIGSGVEAPVDFSQKAESILKKAGVDFSDSAATAAIESEKAALAGDKKEAVYMSLLELGFAIMGGTDPNALTNIGKAGMQVAPALAKRIQATKDARRRVTDAEIKLEEIRNKRAEGIAGISAKMQMNAENNAAAAERSYLQVKGALAASFLTNDRAMKVAEVKADASRDVATMQLNKLGSAAEVIQLLKKPGETNAQAAQRYLELKKTPNSSQLILDAINKNNGSSGSFTPDSEKDAYLKSRNL